MAEMALSGSSKVVFIRPQALVKPRMRIKDRIRVGIFFNACGMTKQDLLRSVKKPCGVGGVGLCARWFHLIDIYLTSMYCQKSKGNPCQHEANEMPKKIFIYEGVDRGAGCCRMVGLYGSALKSGLPGSLKVWSDNVRGCPRPFGPWRLRGARRCLVRCRAP